MVVNISLGSNAHHTIPSIKWEYLRIYKKEANIMTVIKSFQSRWRLHILPVIVLNPFKLCTDFVLFCNKLNIIVMGM